MSCWKCGTDDCDNCGECNICGSEMDGTEHYDDMCDECGRTEGFDLPEDSESTELHNEVEAV